MISRVNVKECCKKLLTVRVTYIITFHSCLPRKNIEVTQSVVDLRYLALLHLLRHCSLPVVQLKVGFMWFQSVGSQAHMGGKPKGL